MTTDDAAGTVRISGLEGQTEGETLVLPVRDNPQLGFYLARAAVKALNPDDALALLPDLAKVVARRGALAEHVARRKKEEEEEERRGEEQRSIDMDTGAVARAELQGEQPLMSLLWALAQHPGDEAVDLSKELDLIHHAVFFKGLSFNRNQPIYPCTVSSSEPFSHANIKFAGASRPGASAKSAETDSLKKNHTNLFGQDCRDSQPERNTLHNTHTQYWSGVYCQYSIRARSSSVLSFRSSHSPEMRWRRAAGVMLRTQGRSTRPSRKDWRSMAAVWRLCGGMRTCVRSVPLRHANGNR